MRSTTPTRRRGGAHVLAGLLALFAVAVTVVALAPASAHAQGRQELIRQAYRIMTYDYSTFHNYKIRQHPRPFDWGDNGCNTRDWGFGLNLPAGALHRHFLVLFDWPCEQHDFGYRNYGAGLKLNPKESGRAWIDWRLLVEMRRACANRYRSKPTRRNVCLRYARLVHEGVRKGGGSFYG
jgi:phospholipase A2-like protein